MNTKEKLIEYFKENPYLRMCDYAKKFHISTKTVRVYLRNVDNRPPRINSTKYKISDEQYIDIKNLIEQGYSQKYVAQKYSYLGINEKTISYYCLKYNITAKSDKIERDSSGLWDKTVEDIIDRDLKTVVTQSRKTTLEDEALGVDIPGYGYCYDITRLLGYEERNLPIQLPQWKKDLIKKGVVNYGREYDAYKV